MTAMSDIDDLAALLDRWQVPYERGNEKADEPDEQTICVGDRDIYGITDTSERLTGYNGFYTLFEFDADGAFVKMGAWE